MNEIKLKINFTDRTLSKEGVNLVDSDFNSTKIIFEFDKEYEGRKVFEMAKPNTTEAIFVSEIIDNEVILVGKAEVKDSRGYIKYIDNEENIYWYDKENNKIYDESGTEQTEIDINDLTEVLVNASIWNEAGDYNFEVSLYEEDSKLTSVSSSLKVKPEMVKIGDTEVERYLPVFDQLLQELNNKTEAADRQDIDLIDSTTKAEIIITRKTGEQKIATIPKGGGGGGTFNHAELENLDFENSGHTGFQAEIEDLEEIRKGAIKPYTSLERLANYLYKISFETIPAEINVNTVISGCTSFVQNGKLYRNLDWNYDKTNSFLVQCKGFKGMAFINGLTDDNMEDELMGQLPYHLVDGVNENGIMVSTHILYNDWDWHGAGNKNISLTKLPYIILNEVKSIDELSSKLANVLNNIKVPTAMEAVEYLAQYIVTDGTTTYAILPPTNSTGSYVIQDITSNPKLTNFRWVNSVTVDRADLQTRPTGVERWNAIPTTLENLRFTKAYEEPTRLSEFIGINGTTKNSTDEELTEIYNTAHTLYENRTRNGATWQTVHSVVYSRKGIDKLYIQENWDRDYINISGIEQETDPTVPNHVKAIQQLDINNWNNKAEMQDISTAVSTETTNRENADVNLQSQIDALANANDVVDVLATYQDLLDYDTTNLKNNDIIKIMADSTHSNAISYFKWVITEDTGAWSYVGSQGPFYTKSETDTLLNNKENTSNKVTTISAGSTDEQYPSAKCVYDLVGNINTTLEAIINGGV